jgi:hypothetical protein
MELEVEQAYIPETPEQARFRERWEQSMVYKEHRDL